MPEEPTESRKPEEVQEPAAGAGSSTPAFPPDYEDLKRSKAEYDSVSAALEPHRERIQRLINDAEYGAFIDSSYENYKTLRETQKPTLGPEWDPANNPYIKTIDHVGKYVESLEKRQDDYEKERAATWQRDAMAYAGRLQAENPQLADSLAADDGYFAKAITVRAQSKGMSFEDGVKEFTTRFGAGAMKKDPPPSLPPNAGAANIVDTPPKQSRERSREPLSPAERRARMADIFAREQKKAG